MLVRKNIIWWARSRQCNNSRVSNHLKCTKNCYVHWCIPIGIKITLKFCTPELVWPIRREFGFHFRIWPQLQESLLVLNWSIMRRGACRLIAFSSTFCGTVPSVYCSLAAFSKAAAVTLPGNTHRTFVKITRCHLSFQWKSYMSNSFSFFPLRTFSQAKVFQVWSRNWTEFAFEIIEWFPVSKLSFQPDVNFQSPASIPMMLVL